MNKLNIKLNKTYDYFDDGKVKESRRMPVTITDIIPFGQIDKETLQVWKEEINECDWLYAQETDFFIKGNLKLGYNENEAIIFVRTIHNDWFSIGLWSGSLDIDGSLASSCTKNPI
jgi:hypothetical protein